MSGKCSVNPTCTGAACCIIFDVELCPEDFIRMPDIHVEDDGLTLKFAGERCPYLDNHNLCTIYKNRPNVCRQYDCLCDSRVKLRKENTMYTIIHFREINASDPNEAADVLVQVQTSAVNQDALNRLNEAVAEKKLDDAADPDEIVAYAMDKAFGEGNWGHPKTHEVEF